MNMTAELAEQLGRIDAGIQGVNDRLDRINGQIDRHGVDIGQIQARCAAHDMMSVGGSKDGLALDRWREGVDADIQSLRESRAGMKSTLSLIGTLLILGLMGWQSISTHQQVQAQQVPQQQVVPRQSR